jgi:hypothetical protein
MTAEISDLPYTRLARRHADDRQIGPHSPKAATASTARSFCVLTFIASVSSWPWPESRHAGNDQPVALRGTTSLAVSVWTISPR